MVSAVTDFYRDQYPNPRSFSISWETYTEYTRLKSMAIELDIKLEQPDCEKPEVEAWEKEMEEAAKVWKEQNS
jgi:hypothetical protein